MKYLLLRVILPKSPSCPRSEVEDAEKTKWFESHLIALLEPRDMLTRMHGQAQKASSVVMCMRVRFFVCVCTPRSTNMSYSKEIDKLVTDHFLRIPGETRTFSKVLLNK